MEKILLRNAEAADFASIVALNASEVQHTSPMDEVCTQELHALSAYHRVATVDGAVAAFLLAMQDHASYRNDNYEWFAARYERFLYVDRIVVGNAFQGRKLGSLLYDDLFAFARNAGIPMITCEFNIVPPNEPSRIFHDKFGFEEVGTQWLGGGAKQVSLRAARIQ
ncbi:MAG: GNAT family N-acetyltransferase [Candidatus Kapaibacterium sp.]|nr:MAG: GNAT family N-acetyltransferase [Candidatus Kapabacteria bacterium]